MTLKPDTRIPLPPVAASEPPADLPTPSHLRLMPKFVWLFGALILVVGLVLYLGREKFDEDAAFITMTNCNAHLYERNAAGKGRQSSSPYIRSLRDGLDDSFAIKHASEDRDGLAHVVELCDTQPQTGLRLFRRAMDSESASAKIVALYCSTFLARSQVRPQPDTKHGVLEAEDFARILKAANPATESNFEVRASAMKAISDLTVITNIKDKERYEKLPPMTNLTPAPNQPSEYDSGSREVKTKESTLNGEKVLLVRWSHLDLAQAWLNTHAKDGAAWDKEKQRYVISK